MSILQDHIKNAIEPAFRILPDKMSAPGSRDRAVCQMLAIMMQESRGVYRRQIGGPAVGLWQFEKGGGIKGVLAHASTREAAQVACRARAVPATADAVYAALPDDDILAAAFARMLLWTDPFPLPALGNAQEAWDLYIRTWRPGKPHRQTWDKFYSDAVDAVK